MSETSVRFAKKRYELRQALSERMDDCQMVTPDSGGATTIVDANLVDEDDYWNHHSLIFYAGDNVGKIRTVSDWEHDTNTLTFATVTTAVDTEDLAEIHIKFTATRYNQVINDAIDMAADFFLIPAVDETLVLSVWKKGSAGRAMKREYDIPAGFDYIDKIIMETTQTKQLIDCEEVWSDVDAAVTAALDDDDYQQGNNSLQFTVADTISNGDVIASKDLDAAVDLSMYQKISFWMKVTSAVAAADLELLLAADSAVATPIETIELPVIAANTWTFVRCTLATPELDTAILSIGFEYDANKKANVIKVDIIGAVLEGQPFFGEDGEFDHRDWSIVKDTTPKIKFRKDVSLTPGKALRLEGQTHQAVLSEETDTCAVPPEYILMQACAMLHQSKGDATQQAPAQMIADVMKRKVRVLPRPHAKAVKDT